MADTNVAITAGSGTLIESQSVTQGGNTVQQQTVTIGDGATAGRVASVDSSGNLLVSVNGRQPTPTTGTITTSTSTVPCPVTALSNATITISGTYTGVVIVFEVSDDGGTTYYPLQVQRESDGAPLTTDTLASSASVMYLVDLPGVTHLRVRATAWATGTANVRISPGSMAFMPVVSVGNLTAGTGTSSSVASTVTTNTTILAANSGRRGASVFNESTSNLFLLLGAGTESATVYTVRLSPSQYYETPFGFTGRLSGHWSAANGSARITEYTA